mmetsp:Transcript_33470/g.99932  ORF Transcript_33470/g.99932 Transcript_33470/m.99932 type:complete len:220 (-) Transcript_33470:16-675(-)
MDGCGMTYVSMWTKHLGQWKPTEATIPAFSFALRSMLQVRVSCRCEHRRLADRPRLGRLLCRRATRRHPPEPIPIIRLGRDQTCLVLPQLLLLRGRREAPCLRRLSRRREGGSAAMRKDGVAAPQARSVARAPRPPSWVQRACLTELLGSRFARCAAAGRRGYCRPAASSSAAARGAHGCIGSSMAPDHCVPRLLCPFRSMLRRWRCPQLPPQTCFSHL